MSEPLAPATDFFGATGVRAPALPARWAAAVRVAIIAAMALGLVLFVAGVPVFITKVGQVCSGGACPVWQMDPTGLEALRRLHMPVHTFAVCAVILDALFVCTFWAVGVVLLRHRSDDPIALFAALTLVTFGMFSTNTISALQTVPSAWIWPLHVLSLLGDISILLFFYLFPDGRFVPAWTRAAAALWAIFNLVSLAVHLDVLRWVITVVMFASAVAAQVYRYRRVSDAEQRRQTKWVVYGLAMTVVTLAIIGASIILALSAPHPLASPLGSQIYLLAGLNIWRVTFLLIPLSIGIAILRSNLFDINVLINRTLVYAGLSLLVVGLYVLIVVGIGTLLRLSSSLVLSLVATVLVAVLFQPARERLQRGVSRLLYGDRGDPYAVLSRLGRQLESSLQPEAILPNIVRMVAETLKLPYVAIELRNGGDFAVAAVTGHPVTAPAVFPLVYRNKTVGRLLVGPRSPREPFGSADRSLVSDLARQIGVAAHAVQLTTDLQRSRERLVAAREEERRRLRRDLHDGLGPMLGSLTLKLDVADELVDQNPGAAHTLLADLKTQTQTAIADIRRLVYALRPPALDDLGLLGAIRQNAGQYAHNGNGGLEINVQVPDSLPPLPAAVEVAALRITQEALTNVVRHAGARQCSVHLALFEDRGVLTLEITDDGRGIPEHHEAGIGLRSMTERAAELGGTCTIVCREPGTAVRVELPCAAQER